MSKHRNDPVPSGPRRAGGESVAAPLELLNQEGEILHDGSGVPKVKHGLDLIEEILGELRTLTVVPTLNKKAWRRMLHTIENGLEEIKLARQLAKERQQRPNS